MRNDGSSVDEAVEHMVNLRPLRWPDDRDPLCALDTSFITDRVYQVAASDLSFRLQDIPIAPPLHKAYRLADHVDAFPTFDYVVIAEMEETLVGVAALKLETWNGRAVLWHLYIAPAYRGRGVGRSLIENVMRAARERQARCLWLETQNVNYGAIQFYRRLGFQCCGLDLSLYDPDGPAANEIALFFVRQLV
jgi:ribosomal protein S18 acetylase RimI-like enzyme